MAESQKNKTILELEEKTNSLIVEILPKLRSIRQSEEFQKDAELQELAKNIQEIAHGINSLIGTKESKDWATPSPERLKEIERWGRILQPHNTALAEIAINKDGKISDTHLSSGCLSLISYTSPDDALKLFLEDTIEKADNLTQVTNAITVLHEHRILNEEHRSALPKVSSHLSSEKQMEWLATLAGFGVKIDTQTILNYLNNIVFDSKHEDQHISKLKPVFQAIANSGDEAHLFKEPLENIQRTFEEIAPGYAVKIDSMIDWIDKGAKPKRQWAKNGSGYLDQPINWKGTQTDASSSDKVAVNIRIERENLPLPNTLGSSDQSIGLRTRLYWILGTLVLGGIGVLVWNSRKGSAAG